MSSNHEVSRERQNPPPPHQNAPEVPRRPRSTLQANRNPHAGRNVNNHNHHPHSHHHHPQPAVREIHKNAWLKRILPSDKKGAPFVKKYDKLWVVFCVHDDVEAFLEFYTEPKLGVSHRPNAYISLNSCLHVSPSIVGQENDEYQFAVTLQDRVVRLVAANWDQMIEWVESLQGKLREMNILSPKDNLYSKLPETGGRGIHCLPGYISTRDPNSPLPPTPNGMINFSSSTPSQHGESSNSASGNTDTDGQAVVQNGSSRLASSNVNVVINPNPAPISLLNENYGNTGSGGTPNYAQPSFRDGSGSDSGLGSGGSIMSISEQRSVTIFPISVGASTTISTVDPTTSHQNGSDGGGQRERRTPSPSVSVVTGNNNSTRLQVGSDENESFLDNSLLSQSHIKETSLPSCTVTSASTSTSSCPVYAKPQRKTQNSQATTSSSSVTPTTNDENPTRLIPRVKNHNDMVSRQLSAPPRPNSTPSENIYEYLFTPDSNPNSNGSLPTSSQGNSNGISSSSTAGSSTETPPGPPLAPRRSQQRKLSGNSHRSSSLNRLEEQNGSSSSSRRAHNDSHPQYARNLRTNNVHPPNYNKESGQQRRNDHYLETNSTSYIHVHGLQGEPMEALIGVKSGEYRIRREETHPGGRHEGDVEMNGSDHLMSHIPLKEQQVMRLRAEMNHPGGVRVVLRKKDCVNSIGFVDYLGAVWIAGWKQQQHPVLYYAFHVGDQILKVAGVAVQNSVEATRAIKMASNLHIEFIIKRIPHGSVFVLKRSREGEPLGLVAINNTPEIGEVLEGGLAASQGLPPSCRGTDGLSNCTWFLTEVNNRPLSLLARENEVRDRLNALGKEISILVQPSDLVKHLKKQLKAMKGFKDYLVV